MTGRRHISLKQHLLYHFYIGVVYRNAILKNKKMKGIICAFLLFVFKLIWAYFLRISIHSLFLHICISHTGSGGKEEYILQFWRLIK